MSADLFFLLSLTVALPLIAGLLKWRVTYPVYAPLLLLFCLGLVTELTIRYLLSEKLNWKPVNNVYILAECILVPVQFARWGYVQSRRKRMYIVMAVLCMGWVIRHLWPGSITQLDPYFRMFYSLIFVLLAINRINFLVFHEQKNLIRHPVFIICTAFIIFFSYQLVYEGIYSLVRDLRSIDTVNLNTAFSIINGVCNLLYTIAILLITASPIRDWLRDKKLTAHDT